VLWTTCAPHLDIRCYLLSEYRLGGMEAMFMEEKQRIKQLLSWKHTTLYIWMWFHCGYSFNNENWVLQHSIHYIQSSIILLYNTTPVCWMSTATPLLEPHKQSLHTFHTIRKVPYVSGHGCAHTVHLVWCSCACWSSFCTKKWMSIVLLSAIGTCLSVPSDPL